MALAILILSFLLVLPFSSAADTLLNSNFESPPTNITTTTTNNTTTPFLLLTKFNTIPGWSFNGTVRYVTAGPNISLPGNKGHAIQLGKGAYINQTFKIGKNVLSYVLTFSLAQGSNECFNKSIAVNVSVPGRSRVFSLQWRYGRETWESHAFVLGTWLNESLPTNIVIRSASLDSDPTCAPIVDTFILKKRWSAIGYAGLKRRPDYEAVLSPAPIHIVTHKSQLPKEFLVPSPESQLVIGFDCEGVGLSRCGTLCIMQIAFPNTIYLVDAIKGGKKVMRACKPALESSSITKVIHDCKRDSEALYFQFGIKLHNVVDTQIAYSLIQEQQGLKRSPNDYISFVGLLADPRYCGISYIEKKEVRVLLKQDPDFWTYRPMSKSMIRAAADDVRFLPYIFHKMMEKLNERSLWQLAVRGALYCRCLCTNDNYHHADWPPVPPIPDGMISRGNVPDEEILSVINVPPGKMGCVIGKRGDSIRSIKASCKAEILMGGSKGQLDKVFIIGPVKQVRKAEAILRGKM